MSSPSMVQRSGDTLIVRSVVSGDRLFADTKYPPGVALSHPGLGLKPITTGPPLQLLPARPTQAVHHPPQEYDETQPDDDLPQCKIKRNYNCSYDDCQFFTQNPRHYLVHIRDVHDEKVRIYDCPNCLYASRHFQKLLRHMKMVHGSADHLDTSASGKQNGIEGQSRKSEEKAELEKKKEEDKNKPKLKCSLCSFSTAHAGQLTRHERKDHKSKLFSCEKCNYVTHIKARFTKHVKYHSMPMIKCEVCDFQTPYKWNLDRHMKNHGGAGAFCCSVCNFTADIKQSLTVHELNHHVPPAVVGVVAVGGRRKNKVGGSDSLATVEANYSTALHQQPLVMDSDLENSTEESMQSLDGIDDDEEDEDEMSEDSSERMVAHELSEDAVLSRIDPKEEPFTLQEDSNSKDNLTLFNSKVKSDSDDSCHQKKQARPIPKLIPLQANQKIPSPTSGPLNLSVLSKQPEDPRQTELVKMSSITANLYGIAFNEDSNDNASVKGSEDSSHQPPSVSKTMFKKKNASFFDKLKEKLMTSSVESGNLSCNNCGHVSKCLSEHSQHERSCSGDGKTNASSSYSSGHGSTRCQYCRHRCKSSLDLMIHMQSCSKTALKERDSPVEVVKQEKIEIPINPESEEEASIDDPQAPHPMENVVFVWNSMLKNNEQTGYDLSQNGEQIKVETNGVQDSSVASTSNKTESEPTGNTTVGKKVFKCPHCAFWASTASRFHVHIVGHLNKKPFECSLCSYRSNWRWDITKHIRLKSVRDPEHAEAKVLMTDETGRRNYTKYNKYITVMHSNSSGESTSSSGKRKELKNIIKDITENLAKEKRIAPAYPNHIPTSHAFQEGGREEADASLSDHNPDNRKTKKSMWKCKRCSYRNPSREALLLHVKKHTRPNGTLESPQESKKEDSDMNEVGEGNQTYRCGHCYQVSNWKHVIQRHCRLKHDGNVKVLPCETNGTPPLSLGGASLIKLPSPKAPAFDNGKCSKCPFTSSDSEKLNEHCRRHIMGPDSIYKCFICSYYVNAEYELLEHVPLHGITNPEEYVAGIIAGSTKSMHEAPPLKRYQCANCPYETNNKSQYMYHEQFHRSSEPGFKCQVCSYQVSKRHLLQQHMKVHNAPQHSDISADITMKNDLSDPLLVWVYYENSLRKMYKCSYCPFVHNKKTQLVHHERMHFKDAVDNPEHINECTVCSFVCDNMGDFWLHTEVHKEDYAKVICNVDLSKSEEEQLQHVKNIMETTIVPVGGDMDEYTDNFIEDYKKRMSESRRDSSQSNNGNSFKPPKSSSVGEQMTLLKEMLSAPINSSLGSDHMNFFNTSMSDSGTDFNESNSSVTKDKKYDRMLHFCQHCPARFTIEKEYTIHMKFHVNRLPYQCKVCSYTARQQSHLMTHNAVHGKDYQRKTRSLQNTVATHPAHTQPNVVMIVSGMNVSEPVWIVVEPGKTADNFTQEDLSQPIPPLYKPLPKHFFCHLCPAKFFKNAALHYHLSLHGGVGPYKCKQCNYAVKTIGNLVKHESVHSDKAVEKIPKSKSKASKHIPQIQDEFDSGDDMNSYKNIPLSGTDLFHHKTEVEKKAKTEKKKDRDRLQPKPNEHFPPVLQADPQFGLLMHGNPDFIYPTYLKNGRQKEKRYKCHKCPSAFEKREQYRVHLSLHGSKQRYRCELCDYSVKYYANYIQHMKKHQMNADAHAARNNGEDCDDFSTPKNISFAIKTLPKHIQKDTPKLSMSEQQILKLSTRRRSSAGSKDISEEKKIFRCLYCPYINLRRDALDNHMRRHKSLSGISSNFECTYCDYTAPQSHILREHFKVHFNNPKHTSPDFYSNYDSLNLYISKVDPETNKPGRRSCVFKSKRKPTDEPILIPIKKKKTYIMPGTGEVVK